MRNSVYLIVLLLLMGLTSCEEDKKRLAESKGQPAELLVVLQAPLLNTAVADSLQTLTDCDAPGLGSSERIFRTMTIGDNGYQKVYKLMHSQLHVELDPSLSEAKWGVTYDLYATPQMIVVLRGPSLETLCEGIAQNRERIQRLIMDFQLNRYARLLQRKYSKRVKDDMQKLGYDVRVPSDIASTKAGKDFLWGSSNRGGDKDINFMFYTYPWNGEEITDTALFVQKRDSVMKANVPGSLPGQYMATTRGEKGTPVLWTAYRKIDDLDRFEVRGLWEMKNGYMGGPFVSLVQVDSIDRRVVVAEGFVFSPNSSKRDLLRSVESALRTLRKRK